ncbi:family with sequence similarity 177, member A1 [Nesidiocoris tenuis]|uniref:Family with sequence similarity 177, member A1 n=1 Tax=Nesidiocoris tenuis TaxID=355587 RepID=A0ABN7BAR0_9HEMI|nr:family with sequence similarity 177, member A1 [Nesidiocoris tenuis]
MQNSAVAPINDLEPKELPSDEVPEATVGGSTVKKKVPRRILHFSDGTLEEFSSDEDEAGDVCKKENASQTLATINPATLEWIPWLYHQTSFAGNKALAVCDYLGEYLANFFGILSPKYEYEIEQYKKIVAEEEERRKQDLELGGWDQKNTEVVLTDQKAQNQPSA